MHQTEIIQYRKLSDSEFAVLIRCCEPCAECKASGQINLQCKICHLHWHTMHASVVVNEQEASASITWARNLAAQNHEAALRAEEHLQQMIGSKVEHASS